MQRSCDRVCLPIACNFRNCCFAAIGDPSPFCVSDLLVHWVLPEQKILRRGEEFSVVIQLRSPTITRSEYNMKSDEICRNRFLKQIPTKPWTALLEFFFLHACIEKSWSAGNWWGMCYVLIQYAEIPFACFCIELVSTVALWRQMLSKNKSLHRAHPPLQIKFSANTELLLNQQAGMTFCCTRWHRRRVWVSFLWIG